jgi:6-phosphofructokinase 2
MILTITPNPSLDLLYEADGLRWDDANRLPEPRRRPGGQGINAARAALALGADATAFAILGGGSGDDIAAALAADGVPLVSTRVDGATRLFIAVRDNVADRALLLNSPGPRRTPADETAALERIGRTIDALRPAWVTACGSVPPGFDPGFHARVGELARRAGARFVPDCDGDALRRAAPGADLLVPNHHEAERLIGRTTGDPESAARAARAIHREFRVPIVAITLGQLGAVIHDGRSTWLATPPAVPGSAVGAGDAFLAALVIALERNEDPAVALRYATAAGAATVAATGTDILNTLMLPTLHASTRLTPLHPQPQP